MMISIVIFIFLITIELFYYFFVAYYACKIFTTTILWNFIIFSLFTLVFFIVEVIFVHDLIIYENNYFEQANIICHILNILFICLYKFYIERKLKKQREQCISLLG